MKINMGYKLLKGAPFGYLYYTIRNKIIGNFIDGTPEQDYLISSIGSIAEFFNKVNKTSFSSETVNDLFDIARKEYIRLV